MISVKGRLLISGAAAALLAAMPATAQTAAMSDGAQNAVRASATGSGEDIVVTAQKREQTILDIPQSISVVSGATLEAAHATNFQDYLKLVPGLQLDQGTAGFGRLILRGVNTGGVASTVGVYVDDTPFGSSSSLVNGGILAGDFDTFDVARVEVLRGPQGTLYGASSMGGILKFVTSQPDTQKFDGRVRGGVETTDGGGLSYYGNAMINIPLGNTLALRASGTYRHNGGFIDSTGRATDPDAFGYTYTTRRDENLNASRVYGGRVALLYTPSENVSVRLSAILQNIENDGSNVVDADPRTLKPLYGGLTQSEFQPSNSTISYRVYNGLVNWNLGFATLTSSTSYAKLTQQFDTDYSYNLAGLVETYFGAPSEPYMVQTTSVKKFTQEVRLASAPSNVFDWMIGGYYTHEKGLIYQGLAADIPGTDTPVAGLPNLGQVTLGSSYDEIAGFANGTLHLGRMFDLDLGGRYSHNHQDAIETSSGALAGDADFPRAKSSENVFTYSVAPKLKLNQDTSIYVRVARGFRPGGPNVLPPGSPDNVPRVFKSDSLTSYEAGLKAETADHTFALDVAVYHIDWNRIQLYAVVNGFGVNVNGTSAKNDGAEFTATFRPAQGLDLSLNGSFNHARLEGDTDPLLIGGVKGDLLPFTPKVSMGVNGNYRWDVGSSTQAFVGGSLRFLSKQRGNFDPDYKALYGRQISIPSYEVVDVSAGLDFGRFSLAVYAKNLNNAKAITSTSALNANGLPVLPSGAIGVGVMRPRSVGVSLTAGF